MANETLNVLGSNAANGTTTLGSNAINGTTTLGNNIATANPTQTEAEKRRLENREAFKAQKQQGEISLVQSGLDSLTSKDDVKQLRQQVSSIADHIYQVDLNLGRQQTYEGLDKYREDGNVQHLNKIIQNPKIRKVWSSSSGRFTESEYVGFSALDEYQVAQLDTQMKQEMLANKKAEDDLNNYQNMDIQKLAKQFVMATRSNGTTEMVSIRDIMLASGYTGQFTKRQLEDFNSWVSIYKSNDPEDIAMAKSIQREKDTQGQIKTEKDILEYSATGPKLDTEQRQREQTLDTGEVNQDIAEQKLLNAQKAEKEGKALTSTQLKIRDAEQYDALQLKLDKNEELSDIEKIEYDRLLGETKDIKKKDRRTYFNMASGLAKIGYLDQDPNNFENDTKVRSMLSTLRDVAKPFTNVKKLDEVSGVLRLVETAFPKAALSQLDDAVGVFDSPIAKFLDYTSSDGKRGREELAALKQYWQKDFKKNFGGALTPQEMQRGMDIFGNAGLQASAIYARAKSSISDRLEEMSVAKKRQPELFHASYGDQYRRLQEVNRNMIVAMNAYQIAEDVRDSGGSITFEDAIKEAESKIPKIPTWGEKQGKFAQKQVTKDTKYNKDADTFSLIP